MANRQFRPEDISTENEIFTLDDLKEAFMFIRSCQSVPILTKAIAAGLVRARQEGRAEGLKEAEKAARNCDETYVDGCHDFNRGAQAAADAIAALTPTRSVTNE